jgi:DNA repair protein RadA/Sms
MAAKTSKTRTVFRCTDCGAPFPKWNGRCGTCGAWNTLVEELDGPSAAPMTLVPGHAAGPIGDIDTSGAAPVSTGLAELDRVLGGGLVPGSVTLVGGEPGIGKSTLLLQLLGAVAASGRRALLVSGEESPAQVRGRAERLGVIQPDLWMATETSLPHVLGHIEQAGASVVVIDSIQTLHNPDLASSPGSVGQVRECSHALVRLAKERGVTMLLVGHVTKEGTLAGPRVLEHIVDTVLEFEGDRHHALRLLRAVKHRFGATGELGLFEMGELGLHGVADPSGLFLGDRDHGASGSVITCTMEGARPLLVETQSLVTSTSLSFPRRAATGLDVNRVAVLLAVLEERAKVPVAQCDVFAAVVGGVRITEPAIDLALCLALASGYSEVAVPSDVVAIGEVGLAGEVRSVAHLGRRLSEAARMGFTTAVVPRSAPDVAGLKLIRAASLTDALEAFGLRRHSGKGKRNSEGGTAGQASGGWGAKARTLPPSGGSRSATSGDNYDDFADRSERADPF